MRCFIVGSAPSLIQMDLKKLEGNVLFGSNQIYKFYAFGLPVMDYYHIGDRSCLPKIEQDRKDGFDVDNVGQRFYRAGGHENYIESFQNAEPYYLEGDLGEDDDVDVGRIRHGWSITLESIQFALLMGFDEIYIIGCDCNYADNRTDFSTAKVLKSHEKINEYCRTHDIKIFNAGIGGILEAYPRIDFDSLWGDK